MTCWGYSRSIDIVRFETQSGFELLKGRVDLLILPQRQPQVVLCLGVVRRQTGGFLKFGTGFSEFSQPSEGYAQPQVRLRHPRV